MSKIPSPDFNELAKKAGIPLDEASWKKTLKDEATKQGSMIANDSKYSPFWRLIENLVVKPTVWLVSTFLVGYVLPNMFVATAVEQWLDLWAWQYNLKRKSATKTRGKVVFQRIAAKGPMIMIPAGTWVQTEIINGTVYRVQVLADTELAENATEVEAIVEAEHAGAAYNLGGGYYQYLSTAIVGVHNISNPDDWIIEAGADDETDDDLRLRIRNQFTSVAKWHIDAAYRALLTARAGINNDNVYFEHNAPRGAGTANAFILLDTGEPSQAMIDDLNTYIKNQGQHGHGDDLLVMAMPNTVIDIGCNLYPLPSLTAEERQTLIEQVELFIGAAFRENTDFNVTKTEPAVRFSFSRLGQELHRQFSGIESLEFDNRDFVTGMNVPRIKTLGVIDATA
ncbi:baseplate J/gp47 family protein [Photobacterium leiognathi]|uniref:baseplate J/gp47 family protein n=1 Tax=Photobacterium leiognathi TaxID=553611 RepID=UPI002980B29B|nr:baseplate J/gp47 family protein [Photobacterium leiognathi]